MVNSELLSEIEANGAFQNKWRRIMSVLHFCFVSISVIVSGAATVFSGLEFSTYATICAGSATVLIGVEKALLLRERWAQHMGVYMQLQSLKYRYKYQDIGDAAASEVLASIMSDYATKLSAVCKGSKGTTQ